MSKAKPLSTNRYAYTIAGPCDFAINFFINATVVWWLFGSQSEVPWYGAHSLSKVWIAIAFFCATLTTFFGYFNSVRERRAGKVLPPVDVGQPWALTAWRTGIVRGLTALVVAFSIASVGRLAFPGSQLSTLWAIGWTGTYAGLLGYWLHTSAIVRAGSLNVPTSSTEVR